MLTPLNGSTSTKLVPTQLFCLATKATLSTLSLRFTAVNGSLGKDNMAYCAHIPLQEQFDNGDSAGCGMQDRLFLKSHFSPWLLKLGFSFDWWENYKVNACFRVHINKRKTYTKNRWIYLKRGSFAYSTSQKV